MMSDVGGANVLYTGTSSLSHFLSTHFHLRNVDIATKFKKTAFTLIQET